MIVWIKAGFLLIILVMIDIGLIGLSSYLKVINSSKFEISSYLFGLTMAGTILTYILMKIWW